MLYYIKTELEKALKKKYTRYYPIGIILTALLANAAMSAFRNIYYGTNDGTFAYNLIMFAKGFFWIPYYACWFAADNVFGEEYPNPLIRDKSTIGLSRTKMYFGKLIVSEIIMFLCAIFATVAFLLITWVFQTHDGTIDMTVVLDFTEAVLITMPLFITGVSISNAFLFSISPKRKAFMSFVLGIVIIPRVIMLLATEGIRFLPAVWISKILITPQFQTLQFYATRDVPKIIISAIAYTAISCFIGCRSFNRRESF